MKRVPIGVVLALGLVIVVGGIVYLVTSLDGIVKRQIEQHGSRLTGTRVTLDGVEIDLVAGSGTIRGLRVANPEGFSGGDAIRLQTIGLAIDLGSLGSQPLRIEQIEIGEVDVRLEVDERGRSNIDALRRHAVDSDSHAPSSESDEAGADEATRIAIERLEFAGGQIVTQGIHTQGKERSVAFPGLSLRNLGGASGESPGAIGQEVFVAFTGRVARSVATREAQDALGDAAEKAAKGLRGLFE